MGMPGVTELLIVGGVVVLLFGVKKIPALGGAIGQGIKNFKKGVSDPEEDPKKLTDDGAKSESNDS